MESLFDTDATARILERLYRLEPDARPRWGKMNVAQMLAHCQAPFEVYFGKMKLKQGLAGLVFGRMAKKQLLSDKPWRHNLPTAKVFLVADNRNFDVEREKLVNLINRFASEGFIITTVTHPFFGKLSAQEWALLAYKHLDHHLQQFGV
jgi:Protein of unknown function (DUF1569)